MALVPPGESAVPGIQAMCFPGDLFDLFTQFLLTPAQRPTDRGSMSVSPSRFREHAA